MILSSVSFCFSSLDCDCCCPCFIVSSMHTSLSLFISSFVLLFFTASTTAMGSSSSIFLSKTPESSSCNNISVLNKEEELFDDDVDERVNIDSLRLTASRQSVSLLVIGTSLGKLLVVISCVISSSSSDGCMLVYDWKRFCFLFIGWS